ncbi:FxLYD domain-containing protein [Gloeobacter kilaueensis]|uniref:Lipoprotein n=1 Tax=Gloeobacter kilaueensis (strain ATCC BAA-2537 / CCAP 1431/1 / ULC 316 / JS1) TaxID=1183438 RepID=U5QH69_GLOK1|nr:FxLYD domain-containing protein [Gloeobacter kilaueensis]AGY57000.1 hypothetical protein GKIL_0754 [Gloeobacter kilaueensis JS1]
MGRAGWAVLSVGALTLCSCNNLRIEPVKVEIANLTARSCSPESLLGLPPDERRAICYEIQGTAHNASSRDLRKVNLYGVIEDAEGTIVREGRIGNLPDLDHGRTVPFNVRVFFSQKIREPLKFDAFRARGFS